LPLKIFPGYFFVDILPQCAGIQRAGPMDGRESEVNSKMLHRTYFISLSFILSPWYPRLFSTGCADGFAAFIGLVNWGYLQSLQPS